MKCIYFCLFMAMLTTWANGQTVNIVADSQEGEVSTSPSSLIANSTFFVYSGNGSNWWTRASSIGGTIYHYWYSDTEVWVSDGTSANTRMLEVNSTSEVKTDVEGLEYTAYNSASFMYSALFNNKVYFSATDGTDKHIYYINGLQGELVKALETTWTRVLPDETNGKVYLTTGQSEPWAIWDGVDLSTPEVLPNQYETDGETVKVKNSSNGAVLLGGKIVFAGSYGSASTFSSVGTELFIYDPAGTEGPVLGNDIRSGSSSSSPKYFVEHNNVVYFRASGESGKDYLWKTDGTVGGAQIVTPVGGDWTVDIASQPFLFNNKLYFEGDDDNSETDALDQLYEYDPSANTLTRISGLLDAYQAGLETPVYEYVNFDPKSYVVVDNTLYFIAKYSYVKEGNTYDSTGDAIYKLNGSTVEVVEVSKDYSPSEMIALGDKIYFVGTDENYINNGDETFTSSGEELFVLDFSDQTTNIFSAKSKNTLQVYPNPSNDYINVAGLQNSNASYKLYNLNGQLIESGIISNQTVDYNVNPGVYLLKINNDEVVETFKIIVQ